MMYVNLDPKLIHAGERTAPKMDSEDFETMLARDLAIQPWEIEETDPEELGEWICADFREDGGYDDEGSTEGLFKVAYEDIRKVSPLLSRFVTAYVRDGNNGVPFLEISFPCDSGVCVHGMLYHDGENYRVYIPLYGNTFDVEAKRPFIAYSDDKDWPGERTLTYWESRGPGATPVTKRFSSRQEWNKFFANVQCTLVAHDDDFEKDFTMTVTGV